MKQTYTIGEANGYGGHWLLDARGQVVGTTYPVGRDAQRRRLYRLHIGAEYARLAVRRGCKLTEVAQ